MSLETKTYTFDELESKYRNFYAPAYEIYIDGSNIVTESMAIPSITVTTSVEPKANYVDFSVKNAYDIVKRDFKWLAQYFVLGKTLEVKMGYTDKLKTVFYGIITSVTADYPAQGHPTLRVKGMDKSTLMMKGSKAGYWIDKKYSDVAKEIGQKYVPKVIVDDTQTVIGTIDQKGMSDFKFLRYMALMCNYDFFLVGKTMYFRKPLTGTSSVLTLSYGQNLRSFSTDMNLADQITKVTVRGWDDKQQKPIVASATEITKLGSGSKTGKDLLKTHGEFEENIGANVDSAEEAKAKAEAVMNERAMKLISGHGECIGLPELCAGRYIKLEGLGRVLNQPYYITSSTHRIDASGYMTTFKVQGNAVG
ncbi:phage late control D family protein [Paenibacillus tyrfis]|uniref:phage late control D family protein n=1 Tax=Paenibacillus tyrfis TaxID=1501230 RepID=UPI00209C8E66|nr:hypothetical protein [Paenibacillus tyrfis]MCP1306949.1 hypothetical protein [Paenibacillus tyrfis]